MTTRVTITLIAVVDRWKDQTQSRLEVEDNLIQLGSCLNSSNSLFPSYFHFKCYLFGTPTRLDPIQKINQA